MPNLTDSNRFIIFDVGIAGTHYSILLVSTLHLYIERGWALLGLKLFRTGLFLEHFEIQNRLRKIKNKLLLYLHPDNHLNWDRFSKKGFLRSDNIIFLQSTNFG